MKGKKFRLVLKSELCVLSTPLPALDCCSVRGFGVFVLFYYALQTYVGNVLCREGGKRSPIPCWER